MVVVWTILVSLPPIPLSGCRLVHMPVCTLTAARTILNALLAGAPAWRCLDLH